MANLVNANSNQNYFQFHGSHYKYEKGLPLGLPISRSIFQNFLQNLEGKFIKRSSQSRAWTHYPTGCLRRHLLHNPIVAGLWYNIIPHLKHETPLTIPSKKYRPMIQLAVTPALLSCVVGGLTCQACNKDSV